MLVHSKQQIICIRSRLFQCTNPADTALVTILYILLFSNLASAWSAEQIFTSLNREI